MAVLACHEQYVGHLSCDEQYIGGAIGGGERAAAPPDSNFVTYGAPVHEVVNIHMYMHSLLFLTCFVADVLDRAPLAAESPIGVAHRVPSLPCEALRRLCRHITNPTFWAESLFIAVVFLINFFVTNYFLLAVNDQIENLCNRNYEAPRVLVSYKLIMV